MKKTQFGDLVITSNPFGKVAVGEVFFSNEPFLELSEGTVETMVIKSYDAKQTNSPGCNVIT